MADMGKEKGKVEESTDDSVFSMYSEWIKDEEDHDDAGENGYEQETAPPVSETAARTETAETVESLNARCEKLRQQIDSEKDASRHIQGNIDRLEKELAESEGRLQELNESQEAGSREPRGERGEAVREPDKKTAGEQEKPRNPFEALLRIVEKNAPEEADALKEIQKYMEEMETDLKSMRGEVDGLKRQLAEYPDSSGLGSQAVKNLEKNVDGMEKHREGFLKKLFAKAAQIIKNFKAGGVIALHNTVQKLGIKETIMDDRKYFLDTAAKLQKSVDRLDAINSEIQAAKSHFKNIGRLAVGKEALQPPQDKENTVIRILKAPHVCFRDRYQKMADKAGKRITRLENLEQKAAQARSTLGKLSDYKKEASAREAEKKEAPGRENTRREPEIAI